MSATERVFVALGSNLEDRETHLLRALAQIVRLPTTRIVALSRFHDTAPWGKADQPRFLNAVTELRTPLGPERLLRALREIERRLGRVRGERWGPRGIDLDLLLYGERTSSTGELWLPHPRMLEREFVLEPLAELAPELVPPGTSRTVREHLGALREASPAPGEGR